MSSNVSVNVMDAMQASPRLHLVMRELGVRKAHQLMWPEDHPLASKKDDPAWRLRRDLEGHKVFDEKHEHKAWREAIHDPTTGEAIGEALMHTCPNMGRDCKYTRIGGFLTKRLMYLDSVIAWAHAMHEKRHGEALRDEDTSAYTSWKQSGEALVHIKVQEELQEIAILKESIRWHKKHIKDVILGLRDEAKILKAHNESLALTRELLAKRSPTRVAEEAAIDAEHLLDIAMSHARTEHEFTVTGSIDVKEEAFLNGMHLGVLQEQKHFDENDLLNAVDAEQLLADDQNDTMRAPRSPFIQWPIPTKGEEKVTVPVLRPKWLKFPEELEQDFLEGGLGPFEAYNAALKEWGNICQVMRGKAMRQAKRLGII